MKKGFSFSKAVKVANTPIVILPLLVLAALTGSLITEKTQLLHINLFFIFDLFGTLFLNAIMLIVVPLIGFSLISGLIRTGKEENRKKLWGKTFGIFLLNNFLAIFVGFVIFLIFQKPFIASAKTLHELALQSASIGDVLPQAQQINLKEIFEQLIPNNIVQILSGSKMLGLIVLSFLFGYGFIMLPDPFFSHVKVFFEAMFQAMINIAKFIMKFLPLGVFCLVAKQFTITGIETLKPLLLFALVIILGLLVFALIMLPCVFKFFTRLSVIKYWKAASHGVITAFSTTSSLAALPIALESIHTKGKVSQRICNLVLPLGITLNMAGSALFAYLGAIFVASAYFFPMTLPMALFLIPLTLIASLGVAAVPSACLFIIIILLKVLGLPGEGIAIILAVDRILDMFRSGTNMLTNTCSCIIVAKSEGEDQILTD